MTAAPSSPPPPASSELSVTVSHVSVRVDGRGGWKNGQSLSISQYSLLGFGPLVK